MLEKLISTITIIMVHTTHAMQMTKPHIYKSVTATVMAVPNLKGGGMVIMSTGSHCCEGQSSWEPATDASGWAHAGPSEVTGHRGSGMCFSLGQEKNRM